MVRRRGDRCQECGIKHFRGGVAASQERCHETAEACRVRSLQTKAARDYFGWFAPLDDSFEEKEVDLSWQGPCYKRLATYSPGYFSERLSILRRLREKGTDCLCPNLSRDLGGAQNS